MRAFTSALFGAAVLAVAAPVATSPVHAVNPPVAIDSPAPATPTDDGCGEAILQFFAAYMLYNVTLVVCPIACFPLVVTSAEMVLEASRRILQECAF